MDRKDVSLASHMICETWIVDVAPTLADAADLPDEEVAVAAVTGMEADAL